MITINIVLFLIVFLWSTDDDVRLLAIISGYFLSMDYLMWLAESHYYFERHILKDMFLAAICLLYKRKDFNIAAIICLCSAGFMMFEYLHVYQSPIYNSLNTIQTILMQFYLIAITYKSTWRKFNV